MLYVKPLSDSSGAVRPDQWACRIKPCPSSGPPRQPTMRWYPAPAVTGPPTVTQTFTDTP